MKFLYLSGISLTGAFLVNLLNYFFTLVTGRLLGPALFSEIATITGCFLLIIVPSSALTLYVAKETAVLNSEGNITKLRALFKRSTKQATIAGAIGFLIFTLCIPVISAYLKIEPMKLLLFGLVIPANFLNAVTNGMFQGQENFKWLSIANVFSAVIKFALAILVIKIGWGVMGVIATLIVSSLVPYFFSYAKLEKSIPKSESPIDETDTRFSLKEFLWDYSFIFWTSLGLALLFNMDVILAKHYFDPLTAGHYAALSILSKIILYASMSLISVMYPIVSASKNGDRSKVLGLSLGVISIIAVGVLGVVKLFPALWVGVLFGSAYYSIIPYLFNMGLAMYFLSIVYCLSNYFIASRRVRGVFPLLIGVGLQAVLLIYSPRTLDSFSQNLVLGEALVLALMTSFYFLNKESVSTKDEDLISKIQI